VTRREVSDEVWIVLEALLPAVRTAGRSWREHRPAIEGVVWKYRTGAPWGTCRSGSELELDLQAVQPVGCGRHVGEAAGEVHKLADAERDDQIAHRRKKAGRPIDFGDDQRFRYRGRNVVERCFNKLKQWRCIAMRTDKLARNYRAAITLAATLTWLRTISINTA
jgi:transposase